MRPCFHIEIKTPTRVRLNGLLFGSKRAKRVIIFVHGLTGSVFSMRGLSEALVDRKTAVIAFNNRGFEQVASVKRSKGKKTEYLAAGTAHEVFTDCVDDIQGAVNFARAAGFREIYLAGHSTGAQKAVYWARIGGRGVRGIILLGPLSDYSAALKTRGEAVLARSVAHARTLIKAGKPHELMPAALGEWFACDAQRFISLYTPDSPEEIFTYARPAVVPKTLARVKTPILAVLAGEDEYGDLPPSDIAAWFLEHLYEGETLVVPGVPHSFKGGERKLAKRIKEWCNYIHETV